MTPAEPSPPDQPPAPDAGPPPDQPLPGGPEQAAPQVPVGEPPPPDVSPPDVSVPEPPSAPYPPDVPPQEPGGTATENENPVLPHTAQAGAARAVAAFSVVIDMGTGSSDPAAALAQIVAFMQQMMADVSRFVPAAMTQTATTQVQQVADSLDT